MSHYEESCIIFSPHPDDACLGCGGTIAKKIKNGEKVIVVNLTDGRNCFLLNFGIENPLPEQIGRIRRKEETKAMKILGVEEKDILFLNGRDGLLHKNKKDMKRKIAEIIEKYRPSEFFIPSIIDKHPDHILTNILLRKISLNFSSKPTIYEYFVWSRKKIEKIALSNIIRIIIKDEIDMKREAISCYRSQILRFLSNQKKPILPRNFLEPFYKDYEVFKIRKNCKLSGKDFLSMMRLKIVSNMVSIYHDFKLYRLRQFFML